VVVAFRGAPAFFLSPKSDCVSEKLQPVDLCLDVLAWTKGRIPETTLRCIRYLRQALPGSTISVEVEKPNREGLVELAAEADVVFYSRSWAEVSQESQQSARTCG
jgi:hypothetical protein